MRVLSVLYYRTVFTGNMRQPLVLPNLADLLQERPRTKMGQIKAAWPYIVEALQAGHTLKSIWECLRADGIDIHYNRLSEYIGRLERRGLASMIAAPVSATPEVGKGAGRTKFARWRAEASADPIANLRERLDRSTGFAYRGTAKKEDLV